MSDWALARTTDTVEEFRRLLGAGRPVVLLAPGHAPDGEFIDRMLEQARAPGVATASPVPVERWPVPGTYELHDALPPAPSLALPCPSACVFGSDALASLTVIPHGHTVLEVARAVAVRLLAHGWRHVATPGVGLAWHPDDASSVAPTAAWSPTSVRSIVGPANAGLETHVSWARSRTDRLRVVVDGACLVDGPNTGTQHLVIEITRWLARTRPSAEVVVATHSGVVDLMRRELGADGVEVEVRRLGIDADVLYRPYQMIFASELAFVLGVGRRGLVGQLDMIGFSNPFYHPADALFFFARNLQRHLMRTMDGVTFISEFGRDSAFAECPDLSPDRLHVVSCGADPSPESGVFDEAWPFTSESRFITCLSSTFWHKNRAHAIVSFDRLVREHGYDGHLVIGGPEPYYGRSLGEEDDVIAGLDPAIGARVHRVGHVTDAQRWWLLRHAELTLYPSVVEGFGLVPFESAAVGTPCLVFAGTAPGELLAGTSALVPTWDTAAWARSSAQLLRDPDAISSNVEGIRSAAAAHTWRACAERTWAAIDHALASPSTARQADDGGRMTRVAPARDRSVTAAVARFDMMRVAPAIVRRLRTVTRAQETTE